MTYSRRGLAVGLILALVTSPAYAQHATTPEDPHVLALDVSAFPSGAVITHVHVDRTTAAVAKENVFGGSYSTTQGQLYQQWHFAGSLFESARLPPFHGAARQVWLLATIFPSRAGAVAAYTSDATFSRCSSTPVLPLPLRAATCTYLNIVSILIPAYSLIQTMVEGYCMVQDDDVENTAGEAHLLCCMGQLFSSAMLLCIADARWRW